MKLIHFADVHIGVETYGSIDPETGLSTRVMDELNALDKLIVFALENKADAVIFCGDAYKNREPSPTHQREFAKRIKKLSQSKIPTIIIVGNHDLPGSPGKANSVEIFDTLNIENIYIASKPGVIRIETNSGELQVAVFPWLRRNALLTREDSKNLNIEQVVARMQEVMAAKLTEMANEINPEQISIFAGHLAVSSAKLGTERNMMIGNEPAIMLSTIANPVYDYIALGHVHIGQVLSENPPVVYSGSLERLDFGDENTDKGFYMVEINRDGSRKDVVYSFHSIEGRRFSTVDVELPEDAADPTEIVLKTIDENIDKIKDAIVRMRIDLPANLANNLREGEIIKALKGAYNISIIKNVRHVTRGRAQGMITGSMSPLDALKKYLENGNISTERREKLLSYGESLINEEITQNRGTYAN